MSVAEWANAPSKSLKAMGCRVLTTRPIVYQAGLQVGTNIKADLISEKI